eukprot:TRINITY_DN13789_c0_g1_i1.p1 TRINITY_DN13789_c0_g1~~TRINITY_DN13789_c0_g1_i1.p1  ORF type:complete len:253 (+),score=64.05 TRINITY_DN13789_c0_g1_i1:103-759(+)
MEAPSSPKPLRSQDNDKTEEGANDDSPVLTDATPIELSPEEIERRLNEAKKLKDEGNTLFAERKYDEAIHCYTQALFVAPPSHKECAVFYANRAACYIYLTQYDEVVKDCTSALELDVNYVKAISRRGTAYERLNKYGDALADFKKVVELTPNDKVAQDAVIRLEPLAKEQAEKEKEEMLGKLKDLGNMFLGKFGLSTDNFKFVQDPNTGSYSVNFKQ